ncbi:MAG: hypothetical protein IJU56_03905 [Clostridia bacterium]|nr:hypothetical protein [Clostridia bacterium]
MDNQQQLTLRATNSQG